MLTRFRPSPARVTPWLLLTLVMLLAAGCLGVSTGMGSAPPGITPGGTSVQDQLAQLAASAQPAGTALPGASMTAEATAAPGSQAPAATIEAGSTPEPAPAALQPTPTRTRRPAATRSASTSAKATAKPTRTPKATATLAGDLAIIRLSQLPPEARTTIRLIEQGGPFPYRQDGVTFQNREGRLPGQPAGYYKEYTVITPGSPDRGARRIIAGQPGELYYTDDHYDTFRRVIQ